MDSADAYERYAQEFLSHRDTSPVGSVVVDRWARSLKKGSSVLELGCGGGYPITRVLTDAELKIWAIDSSPTLVSTFKSRFPDARVQCAKAQESTFFDQQYDAVIAVGLIFLLPETNQTALVSSVADVLKPDGRFLFTAPIEIGEWKDIRTGVHCQSLGEQAYRNTLANAGFKVVSTFVDAGENNYYDTKRISD